MYVWPPRLWYGDGLWYGGTERNYLRYFAFLADTGKYVLNDVGVAYIK